MNCWHLAMSAAAAVKATATTPTVKAAAATVEAATAPAAAEVATTAVEAAAAAVEATTYEATAAGESASAASVESTSVTASVESASVTASVKSTSAVSAPTVTIPRASAEEDSAVEPLRTIVSVGSTGIWGVPVVTVLADRRTIGVVSSDVDAKGDLRMGGGGWCKKEA
jgi:hypothetical protein